MLLVLVRARFGILTELIVSQANAQKSFRVVADVLLFRRHLDNLVQMENIIKPRDAVYPTFVMQAGSSWW